jgi:heme oxygenase
MDLRPGSFDAQSLRSPGQAASNAPHRTPSDLLFRLREATRAQHDSLERKLNVLRPDLSRRDYEVLLGRFLGYYCPLEANLRTVVPWETLGFDFDARRKAGLLVRDLHSLGYGESHTRNLPRCADLPELPDLPAAIGCLYVLEGATLGGQVVARHAAPLLGLDRSHGCAFFLAYGDEVGRRWRAFGDFARRHVSGDADARRAARAARETFEKLERWLSEGQLAEMRA